MNIFDLKINDGCLRIFTNVPISYIITKYDGNNELSDITKCKYIAYDLYIKYIKEGSKYQININYIARTKLNKLMKDKDKWLNNINISNDELFTLFARSIKQMQQLLRFSLNRAKIKL